MGVWAILSYRSQQFWAQLRPQLTTADGQWVREIFEFLGPNHAAQHLFFHMPPADQQHAVAVARSLTQAGHSDPVLLQAALLHDVAKSLGQPLLYRVAVVILQAVWPRLLMRLASAPLTCARWRRPFVVNVHHPRLGAEWAAEVGCSALTVRLIRHHQDQPVPQPGNRFEQLQALLYEADNQN